MSNPGNGPPDGWDMNQGDWGAPPKITLVSPERSWPEQLTRAFMSGIILTVLAAVALLAAGAIGRVAWFFLLAGWEWVG